MRRYRSAIPVLFLFVAGLAYADSIQTFTITSVRIEIFGGSEDGSSLGVEFMGPGISISGEGGMDCNGWCGDIFGVPADYGLALGAITLGSLRVEIGGHTYDETQGALLLPFFITTFDVAVTPSNSTNVPAILNNNNGIVVGQAGTGANFVQFRLKTPTGLLNLPFVASDSGGFVFLGGGSFDASTTVPEPTTLGLMATGLAGIVGLVRRKRGCALR